MMPTNNTTKDLNLPLHETHEEDDNEIARLSPEQFARKAYDRGEFIICVWDSYKFRLSQRVRELMLLGYKPISGSFFTHTKYVDTQPESRNSYRVAVNEDVGLWMMNQELFNEAIVTKNSE